METKPNWDEINKKKELDIAVGQAVNIIANKGLTPIEENKQTVIDWVKFILDCKQLVKEEYSMQKQIDNYGGDL